MVIGKDNTLDLLQMIIYVRNVVDLKAQDLVVSSGQVGRDAIIIPVPRLSLITRNWDIPTYPDTASHIQSENEASYKSW